MIEELSESDQKSLFHVQEGRLISSRARGKAAKGREATTMWGLRTEGSTYLSPHLLSPETLQFFFSTPLIRS